MEGAAGGAGRGRGRGRGRRGRGRGQGIDEGQEVRPGDAPRQPAAPAQVVGRPGQEAAAGLPHHLPPAAVPVAQPQQQQQPRAVVPPGFAPTSGQLPQGQPRAAGPAGLRPAGQQQQQQQQQFIPPQIPPGVRPSGPQPGLPPQQVAPEMRAPGPQPGIPMQHGAPGVRPPGQDVRQPGVRPPGMSAVRPAGNQDLSLPTPLRAPGIVPPFRAAPVVRYVVGSGATGGAVSGAMGAAAGGVVGGATGGAVGGAIGEPMGETGAVELSAVMGHLNVDAGSRGRDDRRRGVLRFIGSNTRPEHVTRKTGNDGTPLELVTNTFRVNSTEFHLFQYHVSFNPDVPSLGMRKSMMREKRDLFGQFYKFDREQLFLKFRLEKDETVFIVKRHTDDTNIRITVQFICEIPKTSPMIYQNYNITFKSSLLALGVKQMNKGYVNPNGAQRLPQYKLEVWPGYDASILQFEEGPMLLVDIIHKVLSMQTVYDQMNDLYRRNRNTFQDECRRQIVGQIVVTRYNNHFYRVDDIDFNSNASGQFELRDGKHISYIEYYHTHYEEQGRITDPEQPLLISLPKARDVRAGQKGPICLIPELCFTTGLSDEMRQDFRVMRDLATHTRIAPTQRVDRLMQLRHQLNENDQARQSLEGWNMPLAPQLARVTARTLPAEEIIQSRKLPAHDGRSADWSKEMRNVPLLTAMTLTNWLCVFPKSAAAQAHELINALRRVCPPMGIEFADPRQAELQDDRKHSYIQMLRQLVTPDVVMVMCVLPSNNKDRYDALKKELCCENPVPSQMILTRTIGKQTLSVATKVAMQMNCKMGGELWSLPMPISKTMVVGIDTYHNTVQKGASVAGFVASLNRNFTRYYTSWAFQGPGEELHNSLDFCMTSAIRRYCAANGNEFPERVIVYRDGVGDGQFDMVREHEVAQIKDCLRKCEQQAQHRIKLMFIIVKKRISQRFFQPQRDGGFVNPPPGTVVDTLVTKPQSYDFFIVSQSVRQGTVTPTCYDVVYDENDIVSPPERIQKLTYKLCHLYYNWPGTIRVPAPCQYAHKVAYLLGESLHRDPDLCLADKLFYL